jgi:hypothetical protein
MGAGWEWKAEVGFHCCNHLRVFAYFTIIFQAAAFSLLAQLRTFSVCISEFVKGKKGKKMKVQREDF